VDITGRFGDNHVPISLPAANPMNEVFGKDNGDFIGLVPEWFYG
jgi:hypothetical protein